MLYTDTTGNGPQGPSGVYIKRATTADFSDAEDWILDAAGPRFAPSVPETSSKHRFYHGLSVD